MTSNRLSNRYHHRNCRRRCRLLPRRSSRYPNNLCVCHQCILRNLDGQ